MSQVPDLSYVLEDPHEITIVKATEESLKGYATIVTDFENCQVEKTPWPLTGWRRAKPHTEIIPGEKTGEIYYSWQCNKYIADKTHGSLKEIGFCDVQMSLSNVLTNSRTHVLSWESTYHPDSGEVFVPKNGDSFVAVLALPGDDLAIDDFVAFDCDGSFGIQTHPFVWHSGMYTDKDEMTFLGKQGLLHACVSVNIVKEFGRFISVPLTEPGD